LVTVLPKQNYALISPRVSNVTYFRGGYRRTVYIQIYKEIFHLKSDVLLTIYTTFCTSVWHLVMFKWFNVMYCNSKPFYLEYMFYNQGNWG
jgi:hypothetical protein